MDKGVDLFRMYVIGGRNFIFRPVLEFQPFKMCFGMVKRG